MDTDRRMLLTLAAALGATPAVAGATALPALYRTSEPAVLLAATQALLAEDRLGTFITVDREGRPRARTVLLSAPDDDLTLWIGTRAGSRKLDQLAAHPAATIHVSIDARNSYASLMGRARRVIDTATVEAKNPYQGDMRKHFFPDYPADFALIAFRPDWLEVATEKLPGRPETWQPEGLAL